SHPEIHEVAPPPSPAAPPEPSGPSIAERLSEFASEWKEPLVRWIPRVAALGVLIGAGVGAKNYLPSLFDSVKARATPSTDTPSKPPGVVAAGPGGTTGAPRTPVANGPKTGSLKVETTPGPARVLVDGKVRGVSPTTINDIPAGAHVVTLEASEGSIRRDVT